MTPYIKTIPDFNKFDCISKLGPDLRTHWEDIAKYAQIRLDGEQVEIETSYTKHDFSHHCYNIYQIISDILIERPIEESLSLEELFLLDVAVLFHDYSMPNVMAGNEDRKEHAQTSAKMFEDFCNNEGKIVIDRIFSSNVVQNHFRDNQDRCIRTIQYLIHSHGDDDIFSSKTSYRPLINDVERAKILAGILRLADALDVTKARYPQSCKEGINNMRDKNAGSKNRKEESGEHWERLKCFDILKLDDRCVKLMVEKEYYKECFQNKEKFEKLVNYIKEVTTGIQDEFEKIKYLCEGTGFENLIVPSKIKADFLEVSQDEDKGRAYRTQAFYKNVLPFLMNKYLPEIHPEIYGKLEKDDHSPYNDSKLPLISLIETDAENLSLEPCEDYHRFFSEDKRYFTYKRYFEYLLWKSDQKGVELFDGDTYILDSIENNTLKVKRSSYFKIIGTADICFFNLIRFFPDEFFYGTIAVEAISKCQEFKDALELWTGLLSEVVHGDFKNHHAGLGVSTLTVAKLEGEWKYPITDNSSSKAAGGYDRIVVPAGAYQPCNWQYDTTDRVLVSDMDPRLQVLREFMEELLDEDELRNVRDKALYTVIEEKRAKATKYIQHINRIKEKLAESPDKPLYQVMQENNVDEQLIKDILREVRHEKELRKKLKKQDKKAPKQSLYEILKEILKEIEEEFNEPTQIIDGILEELLGGTDLHVVPNKSLNMILQEMKEKKPTLGQTIDEKLKEALDREELNSIPSEHDSKLKLSPKLILSPYEVLEYILAKARVMEQLIIDILENKFDKVELVITGVAFDILRMRPEITCLLILKDEVYQNEISYRKSWEADNIEWCKLEDTSKYQDLIHKKEVPLVAPGYAALIWGRDKASQLLI